MVGDYLLECKSFYNLEFSIVGLCGMEGIRPRIVVLDEKRRISVPREYIETARLGNVEECHAWLLAIETGRHRLLNLQDVQNSEALRLLAARTANLKERDENIEPFEAERSAQAALPTRLVSVEISVRSGNLRIMLPRELTEFLTQEPNNKAVLIVSNGFVEIWSQELFDRSRQVPLEELL